MQELEEKARDFLDQFHPSDKRLDEPERPKIDLSSLFANGVKWEGPGRMRYAGFDYAAPDPPWVGRYYEPVDITFQEGTATATVVCNEPYETATETATVTQATIDDMDTRIRDMEAQLRSLMEEWRRYT